MDFDVACGELRPRCRLSVILPHRCAYECIWAMSQLGRGRHTVDFLPPENRARERDIQISKLIASYRNDSSTRADTPFTGKGAKDAKLPFVSHVIGGDWNTFVGCERYQANKHDFDVLFGEGIKTTSGNRPFDNFLTSRDTRNIYTISSRVLELRRPQNSRLSIIGLSDHSPILLEMERSI